TCDTPGRSTPGRSMDAAGARRMGGPTRGAPMSEDTAIPEAFTDIFAKLPIAHVATIGSDGSPQSTPVWIQLHEGRLLFSTVKHRAKYRYLTRDPRIAVSVIHPD